MVVAIEPYLDARMANPPTWVTKGSWTGILINQLSLGDLLGQNIPPGPYQRCYAECAQELVPAMLSSPAFDKPSMEESLSLEGDVTNGYFSIMFAVPCARACGDWVPCLLTGQVSLTSHSYVTVLPVGTFAEVPLSGKDCSILKAIGHSLGVVVPSATPRFFFARILTPTMGITYFSMESTHTGNYHIRAGIAHTAFPWTT